MKAINPYLNFDGTTREAMTFYAKNLGATLEIQSFKDASVPGPKEDENRTMHAKLAKGPLVIMASDPPSSMRVIAGNSVWLSVDCDDVPEIERLFTAFSAGGKVVMPLADQFWGARFGMLIDKFGVGWMFNCQLAKSQ